MVVRVGFVRLGLTLVLGVVLWLRFVVRIELVVVVELGLLAGLGLVLGGHRSRSGVELPRCGPGRWRCGRDGRWWRDGGVARGRQIGIRSCLELDGCDRSRLRIVDGLPDGGADADRSQPGSEDEEKAAKCRRPVHGANPPRSSTPAG
jgi:hypothetical protein